MVPKIHVSEDQSIKVSMLYAQILGDLTNLDVLVTIIYGLENANSLKTQKVVQFSSISKQSRHSNSLIAIALNLSIATILHRLLTQNEES